MNDQEIDQLLQQVEATLQQSVQPQPSVDPQQIAAIMQQVAQREVSGMLARLPLLQGPQGTQGPQGPEGNPGRDGIDGKNGKDGKDGKTGKNIERRVGYADYERLKQPDGSAQVTYAPSGTGALTRTVQDVLRALVRSGGYDTTAHFNTAQAALTETIGVFGLRTGDIDFPSTATTANFGTRYRNSGTNDTFRIGYNLGSSLYAPNLNTEPQAYLGFESVFVGKSELYFRFEGIGLSGSSDDKTTGFVEPFYSNFNRSTNNIDTVAIRAENIVLQNTAQTSYIDLTAVRALVPLQMTVGSSESPLSTLDIQGTAYGATFDGLTIGDNLGASRLKVGYKSTTIAASKLVPGQIVWGPGAESDGEMAIGSRGTVACGISLYTSPDAGTTGLVLRLRINSQGIIAASGTAQELLVGTSTALGAAGFAGFRANSTTGGFFDVLANGSRQGTMYADSNGLNIQSISGSPNDQLNIGVGTANKWRVVSAGGFTALANLRFSHGTSALATNATEGFLHIQSCAGAPSGTPASIPTGQIPLVWDSTNLQLYAYTGGAWKKSAVFT